MKKHIILCLCIFTCVTAHSNTNNPDTVVVSNSADVVRLLGKIPYADMDYDNLELAQFNFDEHIRSISNLIKSPLAVAETNALMHIADFMSRGRPLSVERRKIDFRNAIKHDRFMQYGDSNYVIRAGIVRYGPESLRIRQLYLFRDRYNEHLSTFRINMFRRLKREMQRPRWDAYSKEVRRKLFQEFLRRANATEQEMQDFE